MKKIMPLIVVSLLLMSCTHKKTDTVSAYDCVKQHNTTFSLFYYNETLAGIDALLECSDSLVAESTKPRGGLKEKELLRKRDLVRSRSKANAYVAFLEKPQYSSNFELFKQCMDTNFLSGIALGQSTQESRLTATSVCTPIMQDFLSADPELHREGILREYSKSALRTKHPAFFRK